MGIADHCVSNSCPLRTRDHLPNSVFCMWLRRRHDFPLFYSVISDSHSNQPTATKNSIACCVAGCRKESRNVVILVPGRESNFLIYDWKHAIFLMMIFQCTHKCTRRMAASGSRSFTPCAHLIGQSLAQATFRELTRRQPRGFQRC